ncbi:MAG: hypothetical protein KGD60_15150, partial [Candidatus Thorarchaeota archaeon]|nr:hypothetical protein [Candidatus Thorarchaeota archaeon]
MNRKAKYLIITACLVTILVVSSSTMFATSLSGYQSITAEWHKVVWEYDDGSPYEYQISGTIGQWDASDAQPDGYNRNTYSGEVEQPKWDRNINYHDWWLNDTVTAGDPEGEARHFEWAIDIYTVNVNFRATEGIQGADGAEWWLQFQNNVESVFKVLGAEDAVSYIIYAQTEEYTKDPADHGHAIILPTVSNFEMEFLDGTVAVPPGIPENGSDLEFDKLEQYSNIAIKFLFDDFAVVWLGPEPTVNMVVELNVLTIGRFDYALSYVEAGENEIAPRGALGVFESIGAAIAAGWGGLMDGFVGIAGAVVGPLMAIAVIVVCVVVIIIV